MTRREQNEIEEMIKEHEAHTEAKIGRGMKEIGIIGFVILGYIVLFILSFFLMKKVFIVGIVLMIALVLLGIIALGIYIERGAKKKKK